MDKTVKEPHANKTADEPIQAVQQDSAKNDSIRPTKKQHDLLEFIEKFIIEHGYSPSYREIMQGLDYTSVATVALHVNSLINRGHLQKRDRSARSLEVVKPTQAEPVKVVAKQLKETEAKWLVDKVEQFFKQAEQAPGVDEKYLDQLQVLVGALKVLGIPGAAQSFSVRLSALNKRQKENKYVV